MSSWKEVIAIAVVALGIVAFFALIFYFISHDQAMNNQTNLQCLKLGRSVVECKLMELAQ